MTTVRETIQSPTGGRPRLETVTWTLIGERSQPITGHLRGDPDLTVQPSVNVVLPVGLDVPVTYTVSLPAGALIEPAGTRWQRTGAGLAPLVVSVPDVAGTVDALDHQSAPPGSIVSPDDAALLSNRVTAEEAARAAGDAARPTLVVADGRYLPITDLAVTNARTPTAHAGTHTTGGGDALALAGEQVTSGTVADARVAATIVRTGDVRMADERTPLPLSVTAAKVAAANVDGTDATPSMRTLGTGAQQAAPGTHGRRGKFTLPGSFLAPDDVLTVVTVSFGAQNDARAALLPALRPGASVNSLSVKVNTAGGVGSVMRFGLFSATGGTLPVDLIVEGTVDTSTTGIKTLTFTPVTIDAGKTYWCATVNQGSATPPLHVCTRRQNQITQLVDGYIAWESDARAAGGWRSAAFVTGSFSGATFIFLGSNVHSPLFYTGIV